MTEDTHDGAETNGVGRRRFVQGSTVALALAATGLSAESLAAHANTELKGVPKLLEGMPDNWGRWGDDDELGAINLLGSEEMFAGMKAAMKRGEESIGRFTLQTPITGNAIDALVTEEQGFPTADAGDPAFPGRLPARKNNTADWRNAEPLNGLRFADDRFDTPLYLQGTSHVDALGHGWYASDDVDGDGDIDRDDERLYNGFPAETTATKLSDDYEYGAVGLQDTDDDGTEEAVPVGTEETPTYGLSKADISNAADAGIAGRGVLLDVGRFKGGNDCRLDRGEAISLADLQATAEAQGVEIRERDILLVRTGALERARDSDAKWHPLNEPGLSYSDALLEFIYEMDIPYIAGDNLPVEKFTSTVTEDDLADGRKDLAGDYFLPLHGALLRDLGVTLNEVLDLSDLAAACAEDGVYEFLFTAAPLHVVGGTGGPVNPVVLKATGSERGHEEKDRNGSYSSD